MKKRQATLAAISAVRVKFSINLSMPFRNNRIFPYTYTAKFNGAVTYKQIKVTDAERTENLQKLFIL